MKRAEHGHFAVVAGVTAKTTKGYLRITAGPCRNEYVHRIVAAAMLGRELKRDEQVHHFGDKLDPRFTNLFILGERDHTWVTTKQAWYMKHIKEPADKQEWGEFMAARAADQAREIAIAKGHGVPWECIDGKLEEKWENRNA